MKRTITLFLIGILCLLVQDSDAQRRVVILKSTGQLLESQGANSAPGTVFNNQKQIHPANDIEEKVVTEQEFLALRADADNRTRASIPTLATNAVDGFLKLPATYGSPTGRPDTAANEAPAVYDKKNKRLYVYAEGSWHYLQFTN